MEEKIAIYPFHEELSTLFLHQDKIKNYELVYGILPTGWTNFDNYNHQKNYMRYESDFYSMGLIHNVDAVLLSKPKHYVDSTFYKQIVNLANEMNKKIIYESMLESVLGNVYTKESICLNAEPLTLTTYNEELYSIDVPVVMVLGLGENCDKWNIQLGIYDYFNELGYKIQLISSSELSQLMDKHTLPSFADNPHLTFEQQVKAINAFVKNIETSNEADLIIIGVPGGILKYSKAISNGFGCIPFVISNAVTPDIAILSLYCGEYQQNHIQEIQSSCFYRFNFKVGYFHISNKVANYDIETRQLNYYSIEKEHMLKILTKNNLGFFNIFDIKSTKQTLSNMLEELQNNIACV